MKSEWNVREILIDNTIRLVAEGGFEKGTTRAITHSGAEMPNVKMNEVYIYRLFGSKENLYRTAFDSLDKELAQKLSACVRSVGGLQGGTKESLYKVFLLAWRFVLGNEARCRYYIRYYYSIYFKGESMRRHNALFDKIVTEFAPLFKKEADVKSIMHSVLTTLLDFAVRVYNGDLEDSDINTPHVFNVLYCSMMTYFKDEIKTDECMIKAL